MSQAAEALEAERVKRAFAEISKSWWWFDDAAARDHAKNAVAWQWELLRRSNAYGEFCDKARSIVARHKIDDAKRGSVLGPIVDPAACLKELRRLAASNCPLDAVDPRNKWPSPQTSALGSCGSRADKFG